MLLLLGGALRHLHPVGLNLLLHALGLLFGVTTLLLQLAGIGRLNHVGRYLCLRIASYRICRLELRLLFVSSVTGRRLGVDCVADARQGARRIHVVGADRSRCVVLRCGRSHLLVQCGTGSHLGRDRNTYFGAGLLTTLSRSLQFLIELHVLFGGRGSATL